MTTSAVFSGTGSAIDDAATAGKITKTDKGVLNLASEAWGKITDFFYDKSKDKNQ